MPSTFGTTLRVTVFGQSHSEAIGCVLDGLPSGLHLDMDALTHFIARRTPGSFSGDTPRHERDSFHILSGLTSKGTTCGAPLAAIIENTDVRTGDYNYLSTIPRPGHADFAAWCKWHGRQDASGGGQFSGRLTAALCLAGGIAIQALSTQGIHIAAHLKEVAGIKDDTLAVFDASPASRLLLSKQISHLHTKQGPPILNDLAGEKILSAIREARDAGDSVGGLVECVATGIPAGMGSPLFEGLESTIAHAIFSIPAVKGIEFGLGFEAARTRGSKNNDPYVVQDGEVQPATNNAGVVVKIMIPILYKTVKCNPKQTMQAAFLEVFQPERLFSLHAHSNPSQVFRSPSTQLTCLQIPRQLLRSTGVMIPALLSEPFLWLRPYVPSLFSMQSFPGRKNQNAIHTRWDYEYRHA